MTEGSAKNLQLVHWDHNRNQLGADLVLLFGKRGAGEYALDFSYPLTPLQAFALGRGNTLCVAAAGVPALLQHVCPRCCCSSACMPRDTVIVLLPLPGLVARAGLSSIDTKLCCAM